MLTLALADGSRVPVVDVRRSQIHPHFWSRDQYYVQVELRDGCTRDVINRLPLNSARKKQTEISHLIKEAWVDLDPYDHGRRAGVEEGRSEGYSVGLTEGRSEGYSAGLTEGRSEGYRSIVSYAFEVREAYMRELADLTELSPSRRRFLRNAITVLTDIMARFSAELA